MYKKVILLVSILFSFFYGFASIKEVDYDRLIDFMNSRLIGEYVKLYHLDKHFSDLSDELKNVSIDKPIPGKTLKLLLTKKKVSNDVIYIFNDVDNRKTFYDESSTNDELIDNITNNSNLQANTELQEITAILKKDLYFEVNKIENSDHEGVVNEPDNQELVQEKISKRPFNISDSQWLISIILLLIFMIITVVINSILVKLKIARIKDEFNKNHDDLNRKVASLHVEFGILTKEIKRFSQPNLDVKGSKDIENISESLKFPIDKSMQTKARQVKMLYARDTKTNIFDRVFENFEPQYTFFEIEVSDDSTTAIFQVSTEPQTMIRAIKNKSWVLDSVCETVKGSSFDAKSIINEMPGKLKKTTNGSWEIIQKAKITFK